MEFEERLKEVKKQDLQEWKREQSKLGVGKSLEIMQTTTPLASSLFWESIFIRTQLHLLLHITYCCQGQNCYKDHMTHQTRNKLLPGILQKLERCLSKS